MNNYLYIMAYDKIYDDIFLFKYKIIDIDAYEDILIYEDEDKNKIAFDMNDLDKVIENKIYLIGKEYMEEHELELKIIKILFKEILYGH